MEGSFKGWTRYEGILAHQVEDYLPVWADFLQRTRPSRILEIGTADGGFILSIRDQMNRVRPECTVRTYDIRADAPFPEIASRGIDFRSENLFNHAYDELLPAAQDELRAFIRGAGTTVVICDGGSKKNEFNLLAPILKPGDFILAHDYAASKGHFEASIRGRIWNWCEITGRDIRAVSLGQNLRPYMEEEFASIVWVCKEKVARA